MAMNSRTILYDQMTTTTWFDVRKEVIDGLFPITPFWDKMIQNGRIRKKAPEGLHYEVPIRTAKMDQNIQYFGRSAQFSLGEKETLTRILYPVRNIGTSMYRAWEDDQKQRGKAKILDYVTELVDNTKDSYRDAIASDALNQDSDPLAINGLNTLISTTPTTGTIGTVNRSDYAVLQNQATDMTGVTVSTGLLGYMRTMYNDCSQLRKGTRKSPDVILTTQTIYEAYEAIASALRTIPSNSMTRADLGFGDLMFKGAEVFWDPEVPTGVMYFLNTTTLEFLVDPAVWMEMGEWQNVPQTLDRWAPIVSRAQFIVTQFPKNGVLYNIGS